MRRRQESGFTLPEVLIVMVVGSILLGATLTTFASFVTNSNKNDTRNDSVEQARNALDVEARQLRNLAKRVQQNVIFRVSADDFIFQTSDPNRTWVRYCANYSNPAKGKVYQQNLALPIGATTGLPPTDTACPSATSSWNQTSVVATDVINRHGGRAVPLFTFRCSESSVDCVSSPAVYDRIIGVNAELLIDTTPTKAPEADRVTSGVYLRNQNQAPTADFTASTIPTTPRTVLFNGSSSSDYEQRTLSYFWFEGTMPTTIQCDRPGIPTATSLWGGALIGTGVTLQYTWAGTTPASGTQRTVGLVTCDPGDRSSGVVTKLVKIP